MLSATAENTSKAIESEFEKVRAATGDERSRTALAIRDAYSEVASEMNAALEGAAHRFRDAAQELRGMTAQIQRELESTRAELKRGVLELPKETEESASAMRRVVSDQIKALNELASLVTRSNKAVDTISAQAATAQAAAGARAVAGAAGGGVSAAQGAYHTAAVQTVAAPSFPRPVDPFAATPSLRGAAGPAGNGRGGGAPAPQPAAEKLSLRREEPAPRDSGRGGWLSDLLVRASDDEAAGPPAPARAPEPVPEPPRGRGGNALESLNSISVDIARMIVHDAAVDLWTRYEPGVMAQIEGRLYTQQGRQTFEEIRRKYRRDTDFRQTVDR